MVLGYMWKFSPTLNIREVKTKTSWDIFILFEWLLLKRWKVKTDEKNIEKTYLCKLLGVKILTDIVDNSRAYLNKQK